MSRKPLRGERGRFAEECERAEQFGITVEDQIALIPRLRTRRDIAQLFGYAHSDALNVLRQRGKLIPRQRLNFAGSLFEALAVQFREMARGTPRSRTKMTHFKPELYADLGLVLSDEASS